MKEKEKRKVMQMMVILATTKRVEIWRMTSLTMKMRRTNLFLRAKMRMVSKNLRVTEKTAMVTLMRKDLLRKILTKTREMTNKSWVPQRNSCQISLVPSKENKRRQSSLGSIRTILTAFSLMLNSSPISSKRTMMMQVSPPVCPTLTRLVRSNLSGRESEKTAKEGAEGSRGRRKADLAKCSREHRAKEERPKACHPSQQPRGEKRIN